jgi:hypothetical protein
MHRRRARPVLALKKEGTASAPRNRDATGSLGDFHQAPTAGLTTKTMTL